MNNIPKNKLRLIETFIPEWPVLSEREKTLVITECSAQVFSHLQKAPRFVRLATQGFHLCSLYGIAFLPLAARQKTFLNLSRYFPPFAIYTRLLRSLTLLYFMETPLIQQKLSSRRLPHV